MLNLENQISFGGKLLSDFGVYPTNAGIYDPPERDVQQIEIAGRDGTLEIDNERYKNVTVTYPAIIYKDFRRSLTSMTSYLLMQKGYQRIEDSFYPEYYRMGSFYMPFAPEVPKEGNIGKFELQFTCKPYRWLKSGEEPVEIYPEGMLLSPTYLTCKPIIRLYGAGSVTINGKTISVSNLNGNGYADVDCERMQVYSGTNNLNKYATGEFPVLTAGENEITCTARIEITPRWREL